MRVDGGTGGASSLKKEGACAPLRFPGVEGGGSSSIV
eukprot:CAMPEP_0180170054 /NCGR_PEP_ID=MMETSP0986-20121125/33609_1 /TAXON_ID=697907 /ORGANISM="non described non described, Strain CCMP2293" /LENGTH=36 /DNA_ID= /DNA_START= /DNA_END= /DNA_ORIENTATION=